jgi:hypothetical protein
MPVPDRNDQPIRSSNGFVVALLLTSPSRPLALISKGVPNGRHNPAIVVAGHKKPGAPDSPSAIQDTKRYLQDFDRLQKTVTWRCSIR